MLQQQQNQFKNSLIALSALAFLALVSCALALDSRTKPQPNGRISKQKGTAAECGTSDDLAKRVEVCARPLMDLVQGTVEKWPRVDEDAIKLCESFGSAERCIKDNARKCGKGVQKTIISTVGTSVARARKRECGASKASAIVKTTMCLERNQLAVQDWMKNVTSRLSAVETQEREGDKKVNAVCCMVNDIEHEIKTILNPLCPEEGQLVNRLYRIVLEDVLEIVCRNPKCQNFMRPYKIRRVNSIDGIIAIILRIVFSLDTNN